MRKRLVLKVRPAIGIAAAVLCALLASGEALSAPEVVIEQNPMDCFGRCPRNWEAPAVSIQKSGLFIEGKSVTEASLPKVLRAEYKKVSGQWVFVRADADVSYGEVLRICQLIEAAGFRGRVRIINEDIE